LALYKADLDSISNTGRRLAVAGNKAMIEMAQDARRYGILMIEVEPNSGQGMWVAAFEKTWRGPPSSRANGSDSSS
jgi:hypothetical protein